VEQLVPLRRAVVLWRSMNGTGVIGVQIVSTGRFSHCLEFERTRVPLTVMARNKELADEIGPLYWKTMLCSSMILLVTV
jgi:hypothetical protein